MKWLKKTKTQEERSVALNMALAKELSIFRCLYTNQPELKGIDSLVKKCLSNEFGAAAPPFITRNKDGIDELKQARGEGGEHAIEDGAKKY